MVLRSDGLAPALSYTWSRKLMLSREDGNHIPIATATVITTTTGRTVLIVAVGVSTAPATAVTTAVRHVGYRGYSVEKAGCLVY